MDQEAMGHAFGLTGKRALITGGGSGLGLAIAQCMVAAGARVALAGRRREVLLEACAQLGPQAEPFVYDVTDTDGAPAFVARVAETLGGLDILVNNAGRHCKKPFTEVSMADLQNVLDVHLFGSFALSQAAVPYLRKAGGGSILMISSESALMGLTNVTAYSAAKAAMLGLVKTMSGDLSAEGIRVNAIVPGFIETPMFHEATDKDPARQQKILGHTPMHRYGAPADIGWAAVYLCSQAASFVTGTQLVVDGGCCIGF